MFRLASGAALVLALIGSAVLAQHGGYTHAASPAADAKPGPGARPGDDPVVARIDGAEIRRSELVIAAESLPQQYRQVPMQMLYVPLLNQLIDRKLIAVEADKAKLAEEPDVQRRLAVQRERVLQEAFLARELKTKVTDERLKAQYDKTIKDGDRETEVRARHILVDDEAEAKKLSADAKAGGDFAAMAKAKSKDPGAANGGDLGYFKREAMVPEFATAAFALKTGEVSSPVKSPYGWHVIKIEDRRQAPPPSFEASVEELKEQVAEEVVTEMLAGLRAKAKVETFSLDGAPTQPESLRPEPLTLAPQKK